MANNSKEAKIKFTAETGEFNKAINKAESELKVLRSELKLNETQMKNTGASVEGLEKSQKLLTAQLENAQSKTEALRGKLDKAIEIYGEGSSVVANYKRAVANARIEEENITKKIADCTAKLEQQAKAAADTRTATDRLTDEMNSQQTELTQLKKKYADLVIEGKETSDEAERLAREINDLSSELKQSKTAFDEAADKADKLDKSLEDAGDSASNSSDGFTVAKGTIADLASSAIQMAIGKVSEFIDYLRELPEATRELRQDMATLETSFEKQGFTVKEAEQTWKDLYTVFGEDDRAVEAANLIAKMSDNQEDLNNWVTITQGVWGTYQDSLPVEGLAEASNETAKTGQVTGVLADALNWSSEAAQMFAGYMGEDVTTAEDAFNEALKECTTEEERQALITETLTKLYGDAATKYEEASGAQLDAKEATAENTLAQNDLADAIEPVTTAWTNVKTEMVSGVTPAIESVSGLMIGAMEWMREHPKLLQTIATTIGIVAVALGTMATAWGVYTAAQWLANTAILGCPLTWILGAIVAVSAVIAVFVTNWDSITAAVKKCWETIKSTLSKWGNWINTNVIQPVKNFFTNLWDGIKTKFTSVWTSMTSFLSKAWETIKNVVSVGIQFIGSLFSAAFQIITLPFRFIWENCKDIVIKAWNAIKSGVSTAINAVKSVITTVMNAIKGFILPIWNTIKNAASTAWNGIKNAVSNAVNAVKSKVTSVWNSIKSKTSSVFNSVKSVATNAWNGLKNSVSNVVNSVKSKVSSVWSGIKSSTSSAFNSIKSKATSVWNGIKSAITKPIETAKTKIKSIIDTIKGWFNNLKLKLPHIKMPHFKITGSFSLDPPKVPKLSVDWYAKAMGTPMILNSATIFGQANGRLLGGGEAGSEMIGGVNTVMRMIQNAVDRSIRTFNISSLVASINALAMRPIILKVNGREIAIATASDADSVNGLRNSFADRGLVLE